jgi:hypothetical protein
MFVLGNEERERGAKTFKYSAGFGPANGGANAPAGGLFDETAQEESVRHSARSPQGWQKGYGASGESRRRAGGNPVQYVR